MRHQQEQHQKDNSSSAEKISTTPVATIYGLPVLTPGRLLRLPQVLEIIPVSKSTLYQGIKDGKFPAPRKLGARISAWLSDDLIPIIKKGVQ